MTADTKKKILHTKNLSQGGGSRNAKISVTYYSKAAIPKEHNMFYIYISQHSDCVFYL